MSKSLLAGFLLAAALLAGCTPSAAPQAEATPEAASRNFLAQRPRPESLVGKPAPEFRGPLLTAPGAPEATVDLASLRGKVVVLDFWATWCGPCVEALPVLDSVVRKYADQGAVLYAVNQLEEAKVVRDFLARSGVGFAVVMDPDEQIAIRYGVVELPQTVIIGRDGVVRVVHVGKPDNLETVFESELKEALGQP